MSVFLAPESPQTAAGEVRESSREQVLDAVIDYGGELLVVVENKIFDAGDLQAREINLTNSRTRIEPGDTVVQVRWRDLLEALHGIRERNLVAGAEGQVLDDFLTYIEDHFPDLGPFSTLALCRGVESRQVRRLRQLLGDATGREATPSQHGPWVPTFSSGRIGANAYLRLINDHVEGTTETVELALYPADTLTQALSFYRSQASVDGFLQLLSQPGWHAYPNFHFGHFQRGYCWTSTTLEIDDYLDLWRDALDVRGKAILEADWDSYWSWLLAQRIAQPADRAEFDRIFVHSNRTTAVPRPGIALVYRWAMPEAEALDGQRRFSDAIQSTLNSALLAFGEPPLI